MPFRNAVPALVYLAALVIAGCDERKIPTAVESPTPEVPAPAPPPPPAAPVTTEPRTLELGTTMSGKIDPTDGTCSFTDWQSGWAGLCDAFEVTAPTPGVLHATVRWTLVDAAFAVFAKSSTGEQIDLACCSSPVLISLPVDSGVTYRIEIAFIGRPREYPAIAPVDYTIQAVVQPIDLDAFVPLSVSVLGDAAHTHHLSQARVEVIEGASAGQVARFNEVSGLYEFESLRWGYVTLNVSAPGFVSSIRRVPAGTNMPRELELQRLVPLANATNSLSGVTWAGTSRNTAYTDVKVEILDGPLAGIFTFSDQFLALYDFAGLPPGVIHVRASAPWLIPQTLVVTVSGNTRLDFNMQQP